MSNLYTLTAKIHEILPQINQKYGLAIKVESDYIIDHNSEIWHLKVDLDGEHNGEPYAIQAPQIRQILVGLKDVFENQKDPLAERFGNKMQEKLIAYIHDPEYPLTDNQKEICIAHIIQRKQQLYSAEALCQKWLDSLTPMIDTNPTVVLEELITILEGLI